MKYADFAENIKMEYSKRFPDSLCIVEPYRGFGKSITISCYMAGGKSECSFGYLDNDMLSVKFNIDLPNNFDFASDDLPENLAMEKLCSHYHIKPEDSYYCYGVHKIPYRITRGTPEDLVKAFGKYADKLLNAVCLDLKNGKIHESHIALVQKKIA